MIGRIVKMTLASAFGAVAGLALLCGSAQGGTILLNDFSSQTGYYGGTQGWFPYGAIAMGFADGVGSDPAPPVGGSGASWAYMEPGQYYGHFTAQNWAYGSGDLSPTVWNQYSHFLAEIIFPSSGPNQWIAEGSIPLTIDIQFGGGNTGTVDQYDTVNVNTNVQDTPIAVDIPYTPNFDPTATFANITLEIDPGYQWGWDTTDNPNAIPYAAYMYMTNVELSTVPEPATLGALAMSLTMLALRRRYHA